MTLYFDKIFPEKNYKSKSLVLNPYNYRLLDLNQDMIFQGHFIIICNTNVFFAKSCQFPIVCGLSLDDGFETRCIKFVFHNVSGMLWANANGREFSIPYISSRWYVMNVYFVFYHFIWKYAYICNLEMIYCWLLQDEVMLIRLKKRLVFRNSPNRKQNN